MSRHDKRYRSEAMSPAAESIENVTFDSPMCVWRLKCAVERRGRGERERIQTSRGQRTSPTNTKRRGLNWTPPWTSYYGVVRAIRRTGCSGQNGWWSNGEGGLPAINCCHNWSPTLATGFSNAGKFYIYWCSHFLSLTRSSYWSEKGSSKYNTND